MSERYSKQADRGQEELSGIEGIAEFNAPADHEEALLMWGEGIIDCSKEEWHAMPLLRRFIKVMGRLQDLYGPTFGITDWSASGPKGGR